MRTVMEQCACVIGQASYWTVTIWYLIKKFDCKLTTAVAVRNATNIHIKSLVDDNQQLKKTESGKKKLKEPEIKLTSNLKSKSNQNKITIENEKNK